MTYVHLNTQITSLVEAIHRLEIQERSQFEVLLFPKENETTGEIEPIHTWSLITAGRLWERQQLWETRTQIYNACMALQGCLELLGRLNPQVAEMYRGNLRKRYAQRQKHMQKELIAYLSPSVSNGASGSFPDEVKNQEIMLKFMAAARSLDGMVFSLGRLEGPFCLLET